MEVSEAQDTGRDRDKKIRWVIFGTSFISDVMVGAIRGSAAGVLRGVAGRTPERVAGFAARHGLPVGYAYDSYASALADPEVDAVYIGLPTACHAAFMEKCSAAGKHILCEKSLTVNVREAIQAIDAIRDRKVFMMEAQMFLCHPIIARLNEVVNQEKPLGNMVSIDANFSAPIIDLFNREAGGSILDLGCYPVSLCRYLCGGGGHDGCGALTVCDTVTGSATLVPPRNETENCFDSRSIAEIVFRGGVKATIETSNDVDPLFWRFRISCESGIVELSNLWDESLLAQSISIKPFVGPSTEIVMASEKNFYALQIDVANHHISRGDTEAAPPAMRWADSLDNMALLDAWRGAVGLNYPADN
jgi:predicted dehydrogenase